MDSNLKERFHAAESSVLNARFFGKFGLTDASGNDFAPASAKARAAIAIILLAPDQSRARAFLTETLWAGRARPQALGSLRQVLSEIRTALGPHADCFEVDRKSVKFAQGSIVTDMADAAQLLANGTIFLEDIDLVDSAFQRWKESTVQGLGLLLRNRNSPILHVQTAGDANPLLKRALGHGIVDSVADWCAARIATTFDAEDTFGTTANSNASEFILEAHLHNIQDAGTGVHLAMQNTTNFRSEWAMGGNVTAAPSNLFHDAETLRLINTAVDRSLYSIAPRNAETATARYLAAGTLGAARLVFRNEPGDIEHAQAQLKRNFDLHPAGIYLAWAAYTTTLQVAETSGADREALIAQAEDHAIRAVELDPYGAMTLALCSYVQSFQLGRMDTGYDLANRSLAINRANPLAWIFRGATQFFRGDGEAARADTEFAQAIAANGPYRYVVDTFCCVASTVAGHLDEAIRYGEAAARQAPRYRAPLRYLAAIHPSRNDHEALRAVIKSLKEIEPTFTIESLEQTAYPVPALRTAEFFRKR